MRLFADPRIFAFVMIALSLLQSLRFMWLGRWADSFYWACATGLTAVVTFYQRGPS